jgi:glucose-1-phosphate thymidylyltransferase
VRALILAAGYATRMHPLTLDRAKPLLPVGGLPIVDRIADNLVRVEGLEQIALVTNHRFFSQFRQWADGRDRGVPLRVIDDGTTRNDERLGALGDVRLCLDLLGPEGDWLIVAGDNLFPIEFRQAVAFFRERHTDVVTAYRQADPVRLRRTGVAVLADDGRVLEFEEKPAEPRSQWAVPPLYVYTEPTMRSLDSYLAAGLPRDAPGSFVRWLCTRAPVHALLLPEGPLDIGSIESYREADRLYSGG